MAVLSAELVQRLARRRGGGNPVVSLYLNVDGKDNVRPDDYRTRLDVLVKDALAKSPPPTAIADIDRIRAYLTEKYERGSDKGVAVFASTATATATAAGAGDAEQLWEVVPLSVPVDDYLVVNQTPHVRRLETIVDEYETTAVLLTDRQRARLVLIEFGRVVWRDELIDPLPRHDDDKGDWRKDHVKAHAAVAAHHHVRRAANAAFELFQQHRFQYLVLGVADELAPELERDLHNYLRSRLAGKRNLALTASEDEIVAVAAELTRSVGRAKESEVVERLRAGVTANEAAGRTNSDAKGAVAGLDHTLKAVFERRVDTLLVSEGYATEGWRCHTCLVIARKGRSCPMCSEEMTKVDDVVEEAVSDALSQSCRVEFCNGNADLDVLGRIGALLRF